MRAVVNRTSSPPWLWLFPVTYLFHISEEYFGGFTKIAVASSGHVMSIKNFLLLTGTGFVLISIGMILAQEKKSMRWIPITISTVFFVNALSHTTWTLLSRSYNPGVITSWLFWIPLSLFTAFRLRPKMLPKTFWLSVVVGSCINLIVSIVAFVG